MKNNITFTITDTDTDNLKTLAGITGLSVATIRSIADDFGLVVVYSPTRRTWFIDEPSHRIQAALVNIAGRLRIVEEDLAKERAYNRLLWVWSRSILDLYYRFRIDGSPEPPPLPEEK